MIRSYSTSTYQRMRRGRYCLQGNAGYVGFEAAEAVGS